MTLPRRFERTDSGNAEIIAHLFGDGLRYDHGRQRWLIFPEGAQRWHEPTGGELVRFAQAAADERYDAAKDIPGRDGDDEALFARRSKNRAAIDNALALLKALPPVDDGAAPWDTDPALLAVANGVVDLRTGEIRPGSPEDRMTRGLDVIYEPWAKCPRWEQFIAEVFPEPAVAALVRRAVGYSLTAETSEQVLFLLHGRGSNGKSTFLNILRAVAGPLAVNIPFATIEWEGRGQHPADLAAIDGARVTTCSETSETARLNEARLKSLTGGDPITARRLYGQPYTFRPAAKFWLAVNHLPVVRDDSDGFWRRIRTIPFVRQFGPEERDPALESKLLGELPGILAWAVQAAGEWYRQGLRAPEAVMLATSRYREGQDVLGAFLGERCIIAPDASVRAADLYSAYRQWAVSQGYSDREGLTSTSFGRRIGERFENFHDRQGKTYRGIGLLAIGEFVTGCDGFDGSRKSPIGDSREKVFSDGPNPSQPITRESETATAAVPATCWVCQRAPIAVAGYHPESTAENEQPLCAACCDEIFSASWLRGAS